MYERHGKGRTKLYYVWSEMKKRCSNPKHKRYSLYGGRGITVCKEWENNFILFYNWAVANGYCEGLTIDRIDVNGNYCPENCRWVTQKVQCNNQRKNLLIEIDGKTQTLSQWVDETGVPKTTLFSRYRKGVRGSDLIRREE